MSTDTLQLLALGIYAAIALLAIGVRRELDDDWEGVFDALPFIVIWPLIVAFGAVVAAGWCLMWIPRGLVRLVIWVVDRYNKRRARVELPRAEARVLRGGK